MQHLYLAQQQYEEQQRQLQEQQRQQQDQQRQQQEQLEREQLDRERAAIAAENKRIHAQVRTYICVYPLMDTIFFSVPLPPVSCLTSVLFRSI